MTKPTGKRFIALAIAFALLVLAVRYGPDLFLYLLLIWAFLHYYMG